MAYDKQCYELAESFCDDLNPKPAKDFLSRLAQRIQDVIEDEIQDYGEYLANRTGHEQHDTWAEHRGEV